MRTHHNNNTEIPAYSSNHLNDIQALSLKASAQVHQLQHAAPSSYSPQQHGLNTEQGSLATMINFMSEGIVVLNTSASIEMINPVAANLLGESRAALLGRNLLSLMGEHYAEEYHCLFNELRADKSIKLNHGPKEVTFYRSNGKSLAADLSLSSVPDIFAFDDVYLVGVIHDLTAHKTEFGRLQRLARTDYLTGLSNRHRFAEALAESWQMCTRDNLPLSMLLIDVDYFKRFNDEHGHIQGDKCLQKIANVIDLCLPARDCVAARYGGEEFAVLLPRCSTRVAQLIAIRMNRHIAELDFTELNLSADAPVTVSIGVACQQNQRFHNSEALICAADAALYTAKADGRNRIHCN
ncbi:diguanylate cyclase [Lacimicrobium sp. SS2-24]|uniref:GGDEF domain-containing protein n=1 Tax=Lacimicrobium sp. SS2-24 TaxID=2005569 RepID=UPI0011319AC8|nr:diguanylate cyclase [Lacimicrobium sp. SS2-24]